MLTRKQAEPTEYRYSPQEFENVRSQTLFLGLVRWGALALILGVSACGEDGLTAPEAIDDALIVSAEAKNGRGVGGTNVIYEPQRFRQHFATVDENLQWDYQQVCQLNSFEDLDDNNFVHVDATQSYRKEKVNEADGVIMVKEATKDANGDWQWRVTHIGRASWSAEFWSDSPEVGTGHWTLGVSNAQGVVFEVDESDPDKTAELLGWLHEDDLVAGSWDANGRPSRIVGDEGGWDLLNDPLGPATSFLEPLPGYPEDLFVGGEARAITRINELLAENVDSLRGVTCEAKFDLTGFEYERDAEGNIVKTTPIYWIHHNDIHLDDTWPKQLQKLFR